MVRDAFVTLSTRQPSVDQVCAQASRTAREICAAQALEISTIVAPLLNSADRDFPASQSSIAKTPGTSITPLKFAGGLLQYRKLSPEAVRRSSHRCVQAFLAVSSRPIRTSAKAKQAATKSITKSLTLACLVGNGTCSNSIAPQ